MSIDFSQFGALGSIDQSVLENQGTGDFLLPDMKDCVLAITNVGSLSNDSGWTAANFELSVVNDGGSGQYNGKASKYSITIANPNYPDSAQWGIDELKRWAAACGLTQLSSSDQLIGKSFMCNVGSKPNKKDNSKKDQTIRMLRKVGTTQPAKGLTATQPQQGFTAPQQPAQPQGFPQQGFAPQQPQAANPFQQQGATPAFAMQQ